MYLQTKPNEQLKPLIFSHKENGNCICQNGQGHIEIEREREREREITTHTCIFLALPTQQRWQCCERLHSNEWNKRLVVLAVQVKTDCFLRKYFSLTIFSVECDYFFLQG